MNNLRQAAEMALDALRYTCDHLPAKSGVEREVDDAITALQVALAQPDLAKVGEVGVWGHKREWVGLTDEERFLNDCRSPEEIEYAIAIEAKLKERNS